jgi:XTP/dITP diphosphohydrolase
LTPLVVSTRNKHKLAEIQAILGSSFQCLSLDALPGAPAVVEDAPTFEGNATKKAVELARWLASYGATLRLRREPNYGLTPTAVLADDSGLEVDALDGAPGVNSARFASESLTSGNSPDTANNAKLLRLMAEIPAEQRTARFRCALALTTVPEKRQDENSPVSMADDAKLDVALFSGACEGRIGFSPRGEGGFGYDPLFTPDGFSLTFAELGEEVKNGVSHRARALEQLKQRLGRAQAL